MISFQDLHQPTGRNLLIDQQSYLFFGGTAYLGLLDNQEYISLYKEGIDSYGLNNGTSRSNNVQLGIYQEAESKLALRFGFEASALFSSGYLAAQATVRALVDDRELIYAPASHPALWLSINPQSMQGFDSWAMDTVQYINTSANARFVIVSNCIDNLKPEKYDFSVFCNLNDDKEVLFILDDSHGLGIVNENAVSSDLGLLKRKSNIAIVIVSSLAKGLGTDAGLVLGDCENIARLKQHPIFMGASPASPAAVYALIKGDEVYKKAFEKLHDNIDYFSSHLDADSGLSQINGFPVFTSIDPSLYSYLSQNNILISSFPYPLPTSDPLNRIVISALHTKEDLDYLLHVYHIKIK